MTAGRLWTTTLKGIADEIIEKVIDQCVDIHKWPPEISEFKQMCSVMKGSSLIPWSEDVIGIEIPQNYTRTNESVERFINEGAKVCKIIKEIYPSLNWYKIADKFTELKRKTKIYHHELNSLDHIIALTKYNDQDVIDAFGV